MRNRALMVVALASVLAIPVSISQAQTLTTLFNFDGTHGANPYGDLILSGSTLYGMTWYGGNMTLSGGYGDGTVFSIPVGGGTPTTLFNFDGTHGDQPFGSLILSGSTLYGMTAGGGNMTLSGGYGDGTVFSIPVGGSTPTTLFNFDGTHGANPEGSLILSGSTLYGMTKFGDTNNAGTVFSIPVGGGTPTTLFDFDGIHGRYPDGSLTLSGSTLYGMTVGGGNMTLNGGYGDGTIFSIPVGGGTPTTLFNFDGTHGASPSGSLILSGSTVYGMTSNGGNMSLNNGNGDGAVFSLPVGGGTATTLFSFDGTHGANPYGSLIISGSTLYGMTESGGTNGDGTVFSIPVGGGTPMTLFNFDGTHGANPEGSLILSGSTLYGMTWYGGTNNDGTVFALTVPEPSTITLLLASAACLTGYAWRRRTA